MPKTRQYDIEIDGQRFPVKEYRERRKGARFSFGKQHIIFRMPSLLLPHQQKECLRWFETTLRQRIQKNPDLKKHYAIKSYQTGDMVQVGQRAYTLDIKYTDNKTHSAKLRNGIIYLKLAKGASASGLQKSIKTLLSRVISSDFKPFITRRVLELNQLYFQKDIKSVNLKYNQSNWGSCSSKGNINLSSRLLFAPESVIDYVIIHELAHLLEMNHSPRFWKLVSNAMPEYKEKEQWLKKNGVQCDF